MKPVEYFIDWKNYANVEVKIMKETDVKLLAMLLMNTIYTDIRNIVREELERVGLEVKE